MPYETHGFVSGMKLTAQDVKEMDEQIAQNVNDIATLTSRVDVVPTQRANDIRTLRLSAEADAIFLYYGDEMLGSAAIVDPGTIIYCTGLTVTGTPGPLLIGQTGQITVTKQPADCNQSIRFSSSDIHVATVTSAGVVTAVGSGVATITVACGSHSQTVTVKVSRNVSLLDKVSYNISNLQVDTYNNVSGLLYVIGSGQYSFVGNIPFDLTNFVLKPGEAVTLTCLDEDSGTWTTLYFKCFFAVKQISGETISIVDDREDNDRYQVAHTESVYSADTTSKPRTLTYTNNTNNDLYIGFALARSGGYIDQLITDLDDIADYVSMKIGPA